MHYYYNTVFLLHLFVQLKRFWTKLSLSRVLILQGKSIIVGLIYFKVKVKRKGEKQYCKLKQQVSSGIKVK